MMVLKHKCDKMEHKNITIKFEFVDVEDAITFLMDIEKLGYKVKKGLLIKEPSD